MTRRYINLREEAPALRRAEVLLERIRQDAPEPDPELDALRAGIAIIHRAAANGRNVDLFTLDRMRRVLARIASVPPFSRETVTRGLVRSSALNETRELLTRLAAR